MDMNETIEITPPAEAHVGAVETLLGIGELIAAVYAMQPNARARREYIERAPAPNGDDLDVHAKNTLEFALSVYNDNL